MYESRQPHPHIPRQPPNRALFTNRLQDPGAAEPTKAIRPKRGQSETLAYPFQILIQSMAASYLSISDIPKPSTRCVDEYPRCYVRVLSSLRSIDGMFNSSTHSPRSGQQASADSYGRDVNAIFGRVRSVLSPQRNKAHFAARVCAHQRCYRGQATIWRPGNFYCSRDRFESFGICALFATVGGVWIRPDGT